jgi:hypothetical protein
LELALDRRELIAVMESARRAGLVRPLGDEHRADGSPVNDPEWSPTEDGRRRSLPFMRWLMRGAAVLPASALIALLTKEATWKWLQKHHGPILVGAFLSSVLLVLVLGALVYRRVGGASGRDVARAWSRHAVDLPRLNRAKTWWSPRQTALIAFVVLAFGLILGVTMLPGRTPSAVAVVLTILGAGSYVAVIYFYVRMLYQWVELPEAKQEARGWRDNADVPSLHRARRAVHDLGGRRRARRRHRRNRRSQRLT